MYLPNVRAEQPGATYYYSPLNVYPFGVVDGITEPTELIVHVYYEGTLTLFLSLLLLLLSSTLTNFVVPRTLLGEAKKEGKAVALVILKQLEMKGLLNGQCAHGINLVFDNCSGKNKNRMVLRILFFLVKL